MKTPRGERKLGLPRKPPVGRARFGLVVALVSGCAIGPGVPASEPAFVGSTGPAGTADGSSIGANTLGEGSVSGIVRNSESGAPLDAALVVLSSSALQGQRETQTNASGLYAFRDLPPGTYTVQVLSGVADVSKVTTLPKGAKFRANFSLNPDDDWIVCRLPGIRYRPMDESLMSVDETEARLRGLPKIRRGL